MAGMTNNEDWPRLGSYVARRIDHLGLQQTAIQAQGGPSPAKLRDIIHGRAQGLRNSLRRGLEEALEWGPFSIDKVLAGGEPQERSGLRTVPIDDLLAEIRRRVVVSVGDQPERRYNRGLFDQSAHDIQDPPIIPAREG